MPRYKVKGKIVNIPDDKAQAFLAQHPDAVLVSSKTVSTGPKSKEELEKELREGKVDVKKTKTLPDGTIEITRADGSKVYAKGSKGNVILKETPKRATDVTLTDDPEKYKRDICARIKSGGYTAEQAADAGWISKSQIASFKGCENLKTSESGTSEFYEVEEPVKEDTTPTVADDTKKEETTVISDEEAARNPLYLRKVNQRTPWWLQDIVGIAGAFGDLNRINRYMPWQATPNVHLPGATFYDPTRELGANAEQANIQTQGLAAFTGPQALSARSSAIQGQALKNAADIMGRYNNLNVGLANELEQQRAQILNTASQNQANLDTQLWDKYTIMNQQFDNSKAQARQELRKHFINGITNRAKTQALNSLYNNYQTDPESGGFVDFVNTGYTPTPEKSSSDNIDNMWEKAKQLNPNNPTEVFKILMGNKKSSSQDYPYQGYDDLT